MLGPRVETTRRRTRSGLTLRAATKRRSNTVEDSFNEQACGATLAVAPWQSSSVKSLVKRAGRRGDGGVASVEPMMVEGPRGTSLRAVGEANDHKVAGDALSQLMAQKRRTGLTGGPGSSGAKGEVLLPPPADAPRDEKPPSRFRTREFEDVELRGRRSMSNRSEYAFGAVYEHVDSFGKPRIVSSTMRTPEVQFLEDGRSDRRIAKLLTQGRGTSNVVWAGVGRLSAGIGDGEMGVIREAIAQERSKRLNVEKLQSIKPYSAHGW